jgi:hypothetical protein
MVYEKLWPATYASPLGPLTIRNDMKFLYFLFLSFTLVSITRSQNIEISIPFGESPTIDGKIDKNEWKKSYELELYGGEQVLFQKAQDTMYVAIKGKSGGFSSLAIGNKMKFRILHSSTGLITASYEFQDDKWNLIHDFLGPKTIQGNEFPRTSIRQSNIYRNANLYQFSWYANLIEMGPPSETEFAIPLSSLPQHSAYISIAFFQIKADIKIAKLPNSLSDGCIDKELLSGSARKDLHFEPENWIRLININ